MVNDKGHCYDGGSGGSAGADKTRVAKKVKRAHRGNDTGMYPAPEVAADRGGMAAEPVAEKLVEFVIVVMHSDWAVVYFQ